MKSTTDTQKTQPHGDVVLQEMWRIKDTLSAAYGHDIDRLFAEALERQQRSGRKVVNLEAGRDNGEMRE